MTKPLRLLLAALLCGFAATASAQFPAKPVRVIVPFTAGSAIDVNARLIGQKLSEM